MNKRTVLVLSTTMMSIATAACAFCVSQTANAAEKSVTNVESAVATTKSSTPPQLQIALLQILVLLTKVA
ncbi:hypothetical protein CGSMWGv6119V5_01678 [Gardnerella vaginalis 6119V5]|nr:hypothetical protein CGSMWGv6119V5_01678 [Gardnerella vaginalis 6119V5]